MAVVDQVQVAGFVVLAIFTLACGISLLIFFTAVFFEARARRAKRLAKRARLARRDALRDEWRAQTNAHPYTNAVDKREHAA